MLSSTQRFICSALSIVGTAGLVVASDPVAANVRASVPQASVRTGDLDLTSVAGRVVLDKRIAAAASDVCRTFDHEPLSSTMACRRAAITDARHAAGVDRNG